MLPYMSTCLNQQNIRVGVSIPIPILPEAEINLFRKKGGHIYTTARCLAGIGG